MDPKIPHDLIAQFSKFLEEELGIDYPPERYSELVNTLRSQMRATSMDVVFSYIQSFLRDPSFKKTHLDELSQYLTVNETYFFRDGCGFPELESTILPELVQRKMNSDKTIRIWSSGCCTGEEPYSVAILIQKLVPQNQGWNVRILGTDINKKVLQKAREGVYREWAFRGVSEDFKKKYFMEKSEGIYEIQSSIRKMVTFSYLNLAEDIYPSLDNDTNSLDLILCNNTLMYFSSSQMSRVIRRFSNCLLDQGYLIVAPVESSYVKEPKFQLKLNCNIFAKTAVVVKKDKPKATPKSKPTNFPGSSEKRQSTTRAIPKPLDIDEQYQSGEYGACIEVLKGKSNLSAEEKSILVRSFANVGKLKEAEELCQEALKEDSLSPLFHFLLANVLQELDRVEEAILELRRALFLDSNYIMAHFSLAYLLYTQKKEKEAEVHRRAVLDALVKYKPEEFVPGSEKLKAVRLKEIAENMGAA